MKCCYCCKIEKSLESFNRAKLRKDGRQSVCRKCSKMNSLSYYSDNKERHKKVAKNWYNKQKEMYQTYKTTLSCERCPETHIATLDFHHLNPEEKDFSIGVALYGHKMSFERIKKEIDKCIVLCSNCHRKEHYTQKHCSVA